MGIFFFPRLLREERAWGLGVRQMEPFPAPLVVC